MMIIADDRFATASSLELRDRRERRAEARFTAQRAAALPNPFPATTYRAAVAHDPRFILAALRQHAVQGNAGAAATLPIGRSLLIIVSLSLLGWFSIAGALALVWPALSIF